MDKRGILTEAEQGEHPAHKAQPFPALSSFYFIVLGTSLYTRQNYATNDLYIKTPHPGLVGFCFICRTISNICLKAHFITMLILNLKQSYRQCITGNI